MHRSPFSDRSMITDKVRFFGRARPNLQRTRRAQAAECVDYLGFVGTCVANSTTCRGETERHDLMYRPNDTYATLRPVNDGGGANGD